RTIGDYAAELNGLDQLAFTGGMGEHSARLRRAVCEGLTYLGVKIDEQANALLSGEGEISAADSKVRVVVIPANEELMVVRRAHDCLTATARGV
ncbi:MAG: acetate kinase, partial [Eubacteriales bacterium]|nr:acetate kinase [Eubacteriales bacterium]